MLSPQALVLPPSPQAAWSEAEFQERDLSYQLPFTEPVREFWHPVERTESTIDSFSVAKASAPSGAGPSQQESGICRSGHI